VAALGLLLGLLTGCGENTAPDDETNALLGTSVARVEPASRAISGAHVPTLDPMTMADAEILKVLGPGPRCEFRYTSESPPVLALEPPTEGNPTDGVVKVNGHLVTLASTSTDGLLVLYADPIRLTLTPDGDEPLGAAGRREANLIFEIDSELRAGYRGYYYCLQ
jgi:hypothetical protein